MGRKNSISDAKFESFNKGLAQTLVLEPILYLYSMQHIPDCVKHVRTVKCTACHMFTVHTHVKHVATLLLYCIYTSVDTCLHGTVDS